MFSLPTSVLTKKKTPCKARTTKNISEIEHLLKYIKINVALKKYSTEISNVFYHGWV